MIRFLLDTDVLSEPTKPYPDPAVMRRLALDSDKSCTAAVVWMELLYGVLRLPEGRTRHQYLAGVSAVFSASAINSRMSSFDVTRSSARRYIMCPLR
jgi:predicted nucleic acid-binding protein